MASNARRSLVTDRREWDILGRADPMWSVLTDPARRGRRWESHQDEFFASGEGDVRDILELGAARGLPVQPRRALDFGCGVGRLSRALAARADEVVAIDVSPAMLDEARRLNDHIGNCRYQHNHAIDLGLFSDSSFDLVISLLVLQHVSSSELARGYLTEMTRVLAPDGVLAVQLPLPLPLRHRLRRRFWRSFYRLVRWALGDRAFRCFRRYKMHLGGLPEAEVRAAIAEGGGEVVAVVRDRRVFGRSGDPSRLYLATRRGSATAPAAPGGAR